MCGHFPMKVSACLYIRKRIYALSTGDLIGLSSYLWYNSVIWIMEYFREAGLLMDSKELVIVVDFGGQYNQLIARRVRENHVYCEVYPYHKAVEKIKELKPRGVIFTGGPNSVYEEKAPHIDAAVFERACPFWDYATACRWWHIFWAELLRKRIRGNSAKRKQLWIRSPLSLKAWKKEKSCGWAIRIM